MLFMLFRPDPVQGSESLMQEARWRPEASLILYFAGVIIYKVYDIIKRRLPVMQKETETDEYERVSVQIPEKRMR